MAIKFMKDCNTQLNQDTKIFGMIALNFWGRGGGGRKESKILWEIS